MLSVPKSIGGVRAQTFPSPSFVSDLGMVATVAAASSAAPYQAALLPPTVPGQDGGILCIGAGFVSPPSGLHEGLLHFVLEVAVPRDTVKDHPALSLAGLPGTWDEALVLARRQRLHVPMEAEQFSDLPALSINPQCDSLKLASRIIGTTMNICITQHFISNRTTDCVWRWAAWRQRILALNMTLGGELFLLGLSPRMAGFAASLFNEGVDAGSLLSRSFVMEDCYIDLSKDALYAQDYLIRQDRNADPATWTNPSPVDTRIAGARPQHKDHKRNGGLDANSAGSPILAQMNFATPMDLPGPRQRTSTAQPALLPNDEVWLGGQVGEDGAGDFLAYLQPARAQSETESLEEEFLSLSAPRRRLIQPLVCPAVVLEAALVHGSKDQVFNKLTGQTLIRLAEDFPGPSVLHEEHEHKCVVDMLLCSIGPRLNSLIVQRVYNMDGLGILRDRAFLRQRLFSSAEPLGERSVCLDVVPGLKVPRDININAWTASGLIDAFGERESQIQALVLGNCGCLNLAMLRRDTAFHCKVYGLNAATSAFISAVKRCLYMDAEGGAVEEQAGWSGLPSGGGASVRRDAAAQTVPEASPKRLLITGLCPDVAKDTARSCLHLAQAEVLRAAAPCEVTVGVVDLSKVTMLPGCAVGTGLQIRLFADGLPRAVIALDGVLSV